MTARRRCCFAALAALAVSPLANAYYHFVHYRTRGNPFIPVVEKVNLAALNGNRLPVLVAESGPDQMVASDSFAGLVSQVRLAAQAWTDVPSSALDLAFSGLFTPGVEHNSPVVEVVFQDLSPGVLGLSSITKGEVITGADGPFVPILRSTVILPRDLSQTPSWSEGFFLTLTHELGHAIGLQHSLTSGVMATQITRATTKSQPLATDDIVAVSLLYPSGNWLAGTGTVRGRVTLGSSGVNLASVVAVSVDGIAISALTHPDGTYQIQGVPPGSYYFYVHPLPPAIPPAENYNAGVIPPRDFDGRLLAASAFFESLFYPGVKDPNRSEAMLVRAGATLDGVNFSVTQRSSPAVFGVATFSFPGQVAVKPAHLSPDAARSFFLATGYGLTDQANITVVGGAALIPSVKPYSLDPRYLQIDTQFNLASGEGPRHLAVSTEGDLYVLPSAFRLTRRLPPRINSVAPTVENGARHVVVTGTGFTSETRILFDGLVVSTRRFDEANGAFVFPAPPAAPGHRAVVVALNADGQSSLFLQGGAPPIYEYEAGEASGLSVSPAQLPAGVEAMIEVMGSNVGFASGYAAALVGNTGVSVRRTWVVNADRLLANVVVAPNATTGAFSIGVLNGLRLVNVSNGFQLNPGNPRLSSFRGPVSDGSTGRGDVPAGANASVRLSGPVVDLPANQLRLTVNDKPAVVVSFNGGVLLFRVPADLPPGPAVVRLAANSESPLPIVMSVDKPLPSITSIQISGTKVDSTRPARPGELVHVSVSNIGDPGAEVAVSRAFVLVGQVSHPAVAVNPATGHHVVQFVLDASTAPGAQTLAVVVDGRPSAAVQFPVRAN